MEEADTLCSRIGMIMSNQIQLLQFEVHNYLNEICSGIMAGGKLRSLGTQAELKRRHGTGYRLSFTMRRESDDVDETKLRALLCPTAQLVSYSFCSTCRTVVGVFILVMRSQIYRFAKTRVYLLPTKDTELSRVFGGLVEHKDSLGVREWGLSQATLEEAFIRIANLAGVR